MKSILIAVVFLLLTRQAGARWAIHNFSPENTNQYGYTVAAIPINVTNGIQFTVSISSAFTNYIPNSPEQIHVRKLSTGDIPASEITASISTTSALFVFVIPSNELKNAEFIWAREYEGFYKKLGGAVQRIDLNKFYEHYNAAEK